MVQNGEKYGYMKRGRLEGQEISRFLCALLERSLRAWESGNNCWDQYLTQHFTASPPSCLYLRFFSISSQQLWPHPYCSMMIYKEKIEVARDKQRRIRLQWRVCLCCNPDMVSCPGLIPGDHDTWITSSQFPWNVRSLLEIFNTPACSEGLAGFLLSPQMESVWNQQSEMTI